MADVAHGDAVRQRGLSAIARRDHMVNLEPFGGTATHACMTVTLKHKLAHALSAALVPRPR